MLNDQGRITDQTLIALVDTWVAQIQSVDVPLQRVRRLVALSRLDPKHSGIRAALRELKVDLVLRIREAGKANDMPALAGLSDEVAALEILLPEYDLWRARLYFAAGFFGKAIEVGMAAAEHLPRKQNLWVLVMRAAAAKGDHLVAGTAARAVIALSDDTTARLRAEAEAIRQSMFAEA